MPLFGTPAHQLRGALNIPVRLPVTKVKAEKLVKVRDKDGNVKKNLLTGAPRLKAVQYERFETPNELFERAIKFIDVFCHKFNKGKGVDLLDPSQFWIKENYQNKVITHKARLKNA